MWLPKDERRLLSGLYARLKRPDRQVCFEVRHLIPLLNTRRPQRLAANIPAWGEGEPPGTDSRSVKDTGARIRRYIQDVDRLDNALLCLRKRALVICATDELVGPDVTETSAILNRGRDRIVDVGLTIQGFDLGKKYARCFTSFSEWCAEYIDPWLRRIPRD